MTLTTQYSLEDITSVEFSNITYRLDLGSKRISGMIDEYEAIIQALVKLLSTERYAYEIYPDTYGVEFESLIGKSKDYVRSELPRRITDALMADDRVRDVTDFNLSDGDTFDTMFVTFSVNTVEGMAQLNVEVLVL